MNHLAHSFIATLSLVCFTSCNGGPSHAVIPQPIPSRADGGSALEKKMAALVRGAPRQNRSQLNWNPKLAKAARKRARDMGKRGYFSHVDPDGYGPNHHVTQTGYKLPKKWKAFRRANQVESIAAGNPTAEAAYQNWMKRDRHLSHLLAKNRFYKGHTNYGIGHAYVPGSQFGHYWVLITAPPEE